MQSVIHDRILQKTVDVVNRKRFFWWKLKHAGTGGKLHRILQGLYPGGGGGALRYRGGPHPRYIFRGRRGLFLRPPHVRDFIKEGYFFLPRYEVWGSKSPYNPRNIRGSDDE